MLCGEAPCPLVLIEEDQEGSDWPKIHLYHFFIVLNHMHSIYKSINQPYQVYLFGLIFFFFFTNFGVFSLLRRDPPPLRPLRGTHELAWMKSRCSPARCSAAYLLMSSNATRAAEGTSGHLAQNCFLRPRPLPRPRPRLPEGPGSGTPRPLAAAARSSTCEEVPDVQPGSMLLGPTLKSN
jgi:hypothetical protein